MKEFTYTITDELGIHARPAGLLVKEAAKYQSSITLINGEKQAAANKLFAVMGLGVKQSDAITIKVEGTDEDDAFNGMKEFLMANL